MVGEAAGSLGAAEGSGGLWQRQLTHCSKGALNPSLDPLMEQSQNQAVRPSALTPGACTFENKAIKQQQCNTMHTPAARRIKGK